MGRTTRITPRTADVGQSYARSTPLYRVPGITVSPVRTGIFALIALIGALAFGPTAGSSAATSPEFFGTNFSTLSAIPDVDDVPGTGKQAVTFDQLRNARMTLNRIDVRWVDVEPTEGAPAATRYQWGSTKSGLDALIGAMAAKGLRASPLFRFPPRWAGDGIDNRLVPDHYDEFGAFVAAFARRYGPNGEFWASRRDLTPQPVLTYELWNEANLDEYAWSTDADDKGNADPAAYAAMAKTVAPMVKRVQPQAKILGSLSWKDRPEEAGTDKMVTNYVPKFAAQGGLAALDGMGFHPYAPDAQATIDLVVRLRHQLADSGYPQLPIYADEAGQEAVTVDPSNGAVAPTNRAATDWAFQLFPTDAARGANLAFAGEALAASDCGVKQFLPYGASGPFEAVFDQSDPSKKSSLPRTEAWMGLYFNTTGEPTLSAQAIQRASLRWASRFEPGGPGAPAPLALCGGGESPAASKLPITGVFTGLPDGCVKVVTSYDGNPLESAYLRFYDSATGQQVAEARTDTQGEAQQCVPWDLKGKAFRVVANIGQAGTTGVVECDVPGVGCPVGVELRPGTGMLSARGATGWVQPPGFQLPGAPKPCTYKLVLTVGKFTKEGRGPRGRQRLTASVTCNTATPGAKVRFQLLRRAAKGGKEKVIKTVWLTVGKPRVLGAPAMKKGERVVVLHRAEPTIGVPRLRESLEVGAKVPRPVKSRR